MWNDIPSCQALTKWTISTYSTVRYSSHLPSKNKCKQIISKQARWVNGFELMIHHARHHCRDESTLNHSTFYPLFSATTTSKSNKHTSFVACSFNRLHAFFFSKIQIGIFALLLNEHNTIQMICLLCSKSDSNWKIMFYRHGWWWWWRAKTCTDTLIERYLVKHFWWPSIHRRYMPIG